jgi:hypothetical protein
MAPRRSRTLVALAAVAGVVVLYGVAGGLVAPPIAKKLIASRMGEQLGRVVAIDELRFNPYTLDGAVKGLRVMEPDGKTVFVSFDALDVEASWASLRHLAPVVDALTLQGLKVKLLRDGESHYNFSDIVKRLDSHLRGNDKPHADDKPQAKPRIRSASRSATSAW